MRESKPFEQGKPGEALELAIHKLAIDRESFGELSNEALFSFVLVTQLNEEKGDWSAAAKSRSEFLELLIKRLGKDDFQVFDARWSRDRALALSKLDEPARRRLLRADQLERQVRQLTEQGNNAAALKVAHEVVAIRKELQGDRNSDYATSLNNVGYLLHALNRDREALPVYLQALEIRQVVDPGDHRNLVNSLDSLANFQFDLGNFAEARQYAERALKLKKEMYPRKKYPQGTADLAMGLYNAAITLQAVRGAYSEAQRYYEDALTVRESVYPKSQYPHGHPEVLLCLNSLGGLHFQNGNYAQARKCLDQAMEINKTLYPKEKYPLGHLQVAVTLRTLALVLEAQGATGDARRLGERALQMAQSLFPKWRYPGGHPELATGLNNLGLLLAQQGDFTGARQYLARRSRCKLRSIRRTGSPWGTTAWRPA